MVWGLLMGGAVLYLNECKFWSMSPSLEHLNVRTLAVWLFVVEYMGFCFTLVCLKFKQKVSGSADLLCASVPAFGQLVNLRCSCLA